MNKIWILPLEPIEQRYSKQWNQYFKKVFDDNKLNFEFVYGDIIKSNLNSKFFLDPVQTNIWKLSQLEKILKRTTEVNNGDTIFLFDGWFPGIEALKYTFTFLQKDVKLMSYFHAGTYDKYDLTAQYGMESWGKEFENSLFSLFDKIFVATKFHKDLILNKRIINKNKIKVVGFPLDVKNIHKQYFLGEKENLIAFTGRKSKEKGYLDVLELQKKGFPIIITLDKTKNKDEYYKLLAKCKYVISTANQETFGIGIVEGMALGCIPIVPNKLSYPETVGKYVIKKDIKHDLKSILQEYQTLNPYRFIKQAQKYQYENVINKIIKYF